MLKIFVWIVFDKTFRGENPVKIILGMDLTPVGTYHSVIELATLKLKAKVSYYIMYTTVTDILAPLHISEIIQNQRNHVYRSARGKKNPLIKYFFFHFPVCEVFAKLF